MTTPGNKAAGDAMQKAYGRSTLDDITKATDEYARAVLRGGSVFDARTHLDALILAHVAPSVAVIAEECARVADDCARDSRTPEEYETAVGIAARIRAAFPAPETKP